MTNEKNKNVDISESLFQATDILIKKQLEGLSFDKTIEATIIDTTRAVEGIYTVSTGNASFLAYADKDNYKKDEEVMVTIPQGNYDKQKTIISRKIDFDQMEKPKNYNSAFSTLIDIVNNKEDLEKNKSKYTRSIKVNEAGEEYSWDTNIADFINSNAFNNFVYCYKKVNREDNYIKGEIYYTASSEKDTLTLEEFETFSGDEAEDFSSIQEWYERLRPGSHTSLYLKIKTSINYIGKMTSEIFNENELVGYTRLGVKADFTSFLNSYNVVSGNYGLAFLVKFKHNETNEEILTPYIFDSKDFFGDVYNFIIPQTQEVVFDISEYAEDYHIEYIEVYLYQRDNFINTNGQLIDTSEREDNDIILNNLYLTLGIDSSEYVKDTAKIYTLDRDTYQKNIKNAFENNKKTIKLNWIHKDDITGNISRIQNDIPENYEIRWYYYKLGSHSADNFSGASWERFYGYTKAQDKDGYYCRTSEDDIATNEVQVVFYPNVGKDTQQLKVIIIKKNIIESFTDGEVPLEEKVAESKIITFTNLDEISNTATIIDLNALSIRYEDDEKGHYFIYNKAGKIYKDKDKERRTLTAVYDTSNFYIDQKSVLKDCSSIKWYFPKEKSMLIPINNNSIEIETFQNIPLFEDILNDDNEGFSENGTRIYQTGKNNDSFYIFEFNESKKNIETSEIFFTSIDYIIQPTLNRYAGRNTILLEVIKDGQLYTAQVSMSFGTAGGSGSDYTLEVLWDNGEGVFDIHKRKLDGEVVLKDSSGKEVEIPNTSKLNYSWYEIKKDGLIPGEIVKNEENKLYYPVTSTDDFNTHMDCMYCIDFDNNILLKEKTTTNTSGNTTITYDFEFYGLGESKNYYPKYWVSGFSKEYDENQLAYYDLKNFISTTAEGEKEGILYSKLPDKKYKKKISFKPFNKVILTKYNYEGVSRSGVAVFQNEEATFYYDNKNANTQDKKRKAFVQYNNTYIIDPWDEVTTDRTYYYPVYTTEYDYTNIQNILKVESNSNQKNKFQIFTTENTKEKLEEIMNTLYILEIELTPFENSKLIARFPIALKNSDYYWKNYNFLLSENEEYHQNTYFTVDSISGPTEVRYSTTGELDFERNPYFINFKILSKDGNSYIYNKKTQEFFTNEDNKKSLGYWELIYNNKNSNITNLNFLPKLEECQISTLAAEQEAQIYDILFQDIIYEIMGLIKGFSVKEKEGEEIDIFPSLLDENNNISNDFSMKQLYSRLQLHTFLLFADINEEFNNYKIINDNDIILIEEINTTKQFRRKAYKTKFIDAFSYFKKAIAAGGLELSINQINEKYPLKSYFENIKNPQLLTDIIEKLKQMGYKEKNLFLKKFTEPVLNPPSVYFKDIPLYGIQFITNEDICDLNDGNIVRIPGGTVLWTQPIYTYQDNYPSTTLNKWNGKDIVIDNETGIIQTNGFSAGKKEGNAFTGVVIGDWSRTDSDLAITKQTGIYGFNQGIMSYALKDDGTAFFGKDGKGRIYFDGNSARIYSSQWILPILQGDGIYKWQEKGMMLDIDNGIFKIKSDDNREIEIRPGFFKISGFKNNDSNDDIIDLLKFSNNESLLNVYNFTLNANTQRTIYDYENKENIIANYFVKLDSKGSPFLHIGISSNTKDDQINSSFTDLSFNKNFLYITKNGGHIRSIHYNPGQRIDENNETYGYIVGQSGLSINLTDDSIEIGGNRTSNDTYGGRIVGFQNSYYPGFYQQGRRWFEIKPWGDYFIQATRYHTNRKDETGYKRFNVDWNGVVECNGLIVNGNTLKFENGYVKYL